MKNIKISQVPFTLLVTSVEQAQELRVGIRRWRPEERYKSVQNIIQ
jgi:hypothetical protein